MHGAGSVRFDSKAEDGTDGPDGERYFNYVRLVRGGDVMKTSNGDPSTVKSNRVVRFEDGDTGGIGKGRPNRSGAKGRPEGGSGPKGGPDLAAAASKLGISEQVLIDALGKPNQGPPNFETSAAKLGVSIEVLESALKGESELEN